MALNITRVSGTGWPPSAAADTCVLAVFSDFSSWINCTSNISVQVAWAATGGPVATSSIIGASTTNYAGMKTLLNALTDSSSNNIKTTAYATLPGSDPSSFSTYDKRALWNAIVTNGNFSNIAGIYNLITFNSSLTFDTDPTGTSCAGGTYGMYQACLHELTELCGRFSDLPNSQTSADDLFSYSAANTRSFSASGRYASWDGGTTSLGAYASTSDFGDWASQLTGAGYQGNSTASPFGPGFTGDPELIRYVDAQLLATFLPLTNQGLKVAGFPTNTVLPSISGTTTQGQTLTTTNGTWVGQSTITFAYQWNRNGTPIGGATNSTYVLVGADAGTTITSTVTATNAIGSPTATSSGVGPILGLGGVFTFGLKR